MKMEEQFVSLPRAQYCPRKCMWLRVQLQIKFQILWWMMKVPSIRDAVAGWFEWEKEKDMLKIGSEMSPDLTRITDQAKGIIDCIILLTLGRRTNCKIKFNCLEESCYSKKSLSTWNGANIVQWKIRKANTDFAREVCERKLTLFESYFYPVDGHFRGDVRVTQIEDGNVSLKWKKVHGNFCKRIFKLHVRKIIKKTRLTSEIDELDDTACANTDSS